jgi:putative chitinase
VIETRHLVAVGVKPDTAETWLPAVQMACTEFEINTPLRISAFLAQCAHESGGFTRLVENLNYSAEALIRVWPKRFPSMEVAMRYHRQPEKIANSVYASRMGNGPEASGEGWKYRGRGLKQLTGKDNYQRCGQALALDLVGDPDLLLNPRPAARSAGWFWRNGYLDVHH